MNAVPWQRTWVGVVGLTMAYFWYWVAIGLGVMLGFLLLSSLAMGQLRSASGAALMLGAWWWGFRPRKGAR
jgi:hypothetical protein